ncbi:thioredoxin [Trichoderma arundinaceum]|uniref:Thioredoxin n=1 Tax=Trichoderma arundinaceum TaxID=490622 RepID=A0A395NGF2_TRIAR|nr:thioredoxin [Trichoderma arundinaceum]
MAAENDVYTLQYFPFSLYSLMVRFALVLGKRLNPENAPKVEIKLVNLHREENYSEQYLTLVNSRGQVPALTSPALPAPMTESYDISKWLCEKQPELVPEQHREEIQTIMDKLYSFHAKALTAGPEEKKHGIPNQAAELLEKKDLTEGHRRALEIKSVFHDLCHDDMFTPENIQDVEDKARSYIEALDRALSEHSQGKLWVFGERPTIVDAHATAMILRLIDVNRQDVLTERVQEYARGVSASEEWDEVTHGRTTLWNVSLGHVADLNPL